MPPTPAAPGDERRELRVRLLPRRRRRSECDGGAYDSVAGGRDSFYAPNSRCGWRITSTTAHVELKFTELAIENGFDFVRIYAGSTAPTGFSLTDPATEPKLLYAATGAAPPPKLVFAAPVFVTFESDGLGKYGCR